MNKVIFDTNIYNYASLGYPPAEELIQEHVSILASTVIMSIIIEAELMSIPKTKKDLEYKKLIDGYIALSKDEGGIIPISDEIIKIAADVRIEWKEVHGKKLPLPDSIIGATAIVENAILFSNNDKDFSYLVEHYGLNYKNPFDRNHLNAFLTSKGLNNAADYRSGFSTAVEQLDFDSLKILIVKMFDQIPKDSKKDILKHVKNKNLGNK